MCQNISLTTRALCAALAVATLSPLALAKDATMTFTTPSNRSASTVKIGLDPYRDAQVIIPAGSTVELRFTAEGYRGLDVLAENQPYSRLVDCETLQTVNPGQTTITPRPEAIDFACENYFSVM